jgi:phospholipid/cholesterol/gamma-HCH transport system permease protein
MGEFLTQTWFLMKVTTVPVILISIPFGMVIALHVGTINRQFGAESATGSAMVLAIVREAAPVAAALMIAGAGGSAMCADIGSRKIRDEIDAMEVLAVDPIATLVVPRIWAAIFVAMLLDGFVSVAGIAGGYFFNVIIQGGTPGAYLASFSLLAQTADLVVAIIKAGIFGLVAAMVAVYFGFYAKGGPKGVGDAVNRAVVVTFMLIFFVNFVLTALYFAVVPQKFG